MAKRVFKVWVTVTPLAKRPSHLKHHFLNANPRLLTVWSDGRPPHIDAVKGTLTLPPPKRRSKK